MKAVILAAGRGTRMMPLTKNVCKPMLYLHGQPIIAHILKSLPKRIDEVVIVVGYKHEQIREYFGSKYGRIKIRYILQRKPQGTWHALCLAKKFLKGEGKFLVLNADDIHDTKGIRELCKHQNAILVSTHREPKKCGVVKFDESFNLSEIEEKPDYPKSNLVSIGVYVLSPEIFKCKQPKRVKGELYLPTVLNDYLQMVSIKVVLVDSYITIGNPAEYISAHEVV
jgi:NDP-sugar pyrophosphorylase family protein